MITCLELFDSIVEIYPVVCGTVEFPSPFNVASGAPLAAGAISCMSGVSSEPFSLAWLRRQDGLVLEHQSSVNADMRTLLIMESATAKATSKKNVAGRYFQCAVSAKTYESCESVQGFVDSLLCVDYYDLFLVDSKENVFVVRGCAPATDVSATSVLPRSEEMQIDFSIECVNGIQKVNFAA